ncbi:MAG TPA: glycosyltransferase [Pyrinomonadaceae bacterium]|jgi:glycosyltransferase involved in cell wall biosynthesis
MSGVQDKTVRIVRIIARLNVGGPARHVVWLTAGLEGEEFSTLLVSGVVPDGEDDMSYFAEEQGVRPHVIAQMSREISYRDALTVWKLYRLLVRERPSLVHTHTAKAGTVGRLAGMLYRWLTPRALLGRPRRCRLIHTYHGHIFHSYYAASKTRLFLFIEKMLARIVTDKIIVISPQQYHEIHEKFGVGRPAQFAVIPLGLDLALFADWTSRRAVLRAELEADKSEVLVGIVGRLTEIKNHALFLRAAALYKREAQERAPETAGESALDARKSVPRVRFLVIGDGHLRAELERLARELGLEDDVIFTGTRNDPQNFYPALDIVALTSLNEGTPLTLIEAMANERAVLATGVGGVVDLLGRKREALDQRGAVELCERGLLVRPGDVEGFARGLAFLIENAETRRELGQRARVFVEGNYSKERLLRDVSKLYRELVYESPGVGVKRLESKAQASTSKFGNQELDSRL